MESLLIILPYLGACLLGLFIMAIDARIARSYRPCITSHEASVTALTAVYRDEVPVFEAAVLSWIKSGVDEIVAVIDAGNGGCIALFSDLHSRFPQCAFRLLVTDVPGKRPALVSGFKLVTSDIVVLSDADTIWSDNFMREIVKPFADPRVGGACGRMGIVKSETTAERMYELHQLMYYNVMLPYGVQIGRPILCLTGRSAAYRREALAPVIGGLLTETFRDKHFTSGDDIYLTHAVGSQWKTMYQSTACYLTVALPSFWSYWWQMVRWARNTFRAMEKGYSAPKKKIESRLLAEGIIHKFESGIFPLFTVATLICGAPVATAILCVIAACTCVCQLLLCGCTLGASIARAPYFLLSKIADTHSMLFGKMTVMQDGWLRKGEMNRAASYASAGAVRYVCFLGFVLFSLCAYILALQKL